VSLTRARLSKLVGPLALVAISLAPVPAANASRSAADPASESSRDAERPPALRLERGAVADAQIVGLGRDVIVEGDAHAGVTALDGSAIVSGTVEGDVTVLGGNARLLAGAAVKGSVHVVGGRLEVAPGARIEGRSVAYPTVAKAWSTLLEGPSLGLSAGSPVVLAAKLGLVAAWLAVTIVLFAAFPRGLVAASEEIRREPLLCFASGLVAVLAAFLTLLFLAEALPVPLSLPTAVVIGLGAIAARLWGVVGFCHALGRWALGAFGRRRVPPLHAATAGLALLAAAKFLPFVGIAVWGVATFVGVGAALRTRFGREPEPVRVDAALSSLVR
jgi:hypothetical protein